MNKKTTLNYAKLDGDLIFILLFTYTIRIRKSTFLYSTSFLATLLEHTINQHFEQDLLLKFY